MNGVEIQDLIKQLEEKKFWGSVRIVVQDGKIVNIELLQTIKQKVTEAIMLVQQ